MAQPITPRGEEILEIANRFGFWIPNTFDICGSSDAMECTLAIGNYARDFMQSATA
jgi:hypothetical protein